MPVSVAGGFWAATDTTTAAVRNRWFCFRRRGFQRAPFRQFPRRSRRLVFDDPGFKFGLMLPRPYSIPWSDLDNEREKLVPLTATSGPAVPRSGSKYLAVMISAGNPDMIITVYMRHQGAENRVAGVERTWPKQALVSQLR